MNPIRKFNLIVVATFLASLLLMIFIFSSLYTGSGLSGYVFVGLSNFFLVNLPSIVALMIVFAGIVIEARKMMMKTNDPGQLRSLNYLFFYGCYTLLSIPFLFVFSYPLLTGVETSFYFDFSAMHIFPYSLSLGALALISFISNMYLYLFLKSVLSPKTDFTKLQKKVLVVFFIFVIIAISPWNYYALITPSYVFCLRPVTTTILFLSLLYVGTYGIISFSNSYRLVSSYHMVVRLKLFVFGLLVYIFAFFPQVIWAIFFRDESLFIMDYLTVTLVAVAGFFIYLSIREYS